MQIQFWPFSLTLYLYIYIYIYAYACVHSKSLCRVRLCDAMDCSPPGSCVHGILQTRIKESVAISSSRGSSRARDQTRVFYISCICRWILYHSRIWEAPHSRLRPLDSFPPGLKWKTEKVDEFMLTKPR